jgi:Activator of Hsp90 ATPase homolog 1-like protein
MYKEFEVKWEDTLPGSPEQVWDALTVHTTGWIWDISYEPRVGGAEHGLTSRGGTVTAWDPPRHFQTRAEREDGWFNQIDYTLEPDGDGTHARYVHTSVLAEEEFDVQYDQCVQHTDFYRHTMSEYVRHFAGRDADYTEIEAAGSFAEVSAAVRALGGTVDYDEPAFLGVRTDNSMIRVYGRDAWGGNVGVALHLFAPAADRAIEAVA